MNNRIIISTFCLIAGINAIFAQTGSEFGIHGGLGNAPLKYSCGGATVESATGGNIGVDYSYFFTENLGLSLGLEAAFYGSSLSIGRLYDEHLISTPPGLSESDFFLRADYSDFTEKQHATYLQLPVMLRFQTFFTDIAAFYFGGGFKIGVPLYGSYSQTVGKLTATGYSDYTKQVFEDFPQHGFSTYRDVSGNGSLDFKASFGLALEGGLKWVVSGHNALYTGVYLDYGLNDVNKSVAEKYLLEYNSQSPEYYIHNSALRASVSGRDADNPSLPVKIVKPFAIGVKVGLAFGLGGNNDGGHRTGAGVARGSASSAKSKKKCPPQPPLFGW